MDRHTQLPPTAKEAEEGGLSSNNNIMASTQPSPHHIDKTTIHRSKVRQPLTTADSTARTTPGRWHIRRLTMDSHNEAVMLGTEAIRAIQEAIVGIQEAIPRQQPAVIQPLREAVADISRICSGRPAVRNKLNHLLIRPTPTCQVRRTRIFAHR